MSTAKIASRPSAPTDGPGTHAEGPQTVGRFPRTPPASPVSIAAPRLAAVDELQLRERIYRRMLAFGDGLASILALLVAATVFNVTLTSVLVGIPLLVIFVLKVQGLYDRDDQVVGKTHLSDWRALIEAGAICSIAIYLLWRPLTDQTHGGGMRVFALVWLLLAVLMVGLRAATRRVARHLAPDERCLIVGHCEASNDLADRLCEMDGVKFIGMMRSNQLGGSVGDVRRLIERLRVHRLIVAGDGTADSKTLELIRSAKWLRIRVSLLPSVVTAVGGCAVFDEVDGMTLLGVPRFGLSRSSSLLKRAFDLLGACCALLLATPLMLALAVAIKLDTPGPVFFRQTRVGRDGRHFTMIKFRSMVANAEDIKGELFAANEAAPGLFKISNDPRVTRVGTWMRRSHLDEIPQLWNVIRGEMSLVGPRPLIEEEDALLAGSDRHRLTLTPGMTGPWQLRGPLTTPLSEMAKLDYVYVSNWSLWTDLEILVRTGLRVLDRRGH